MTSQYSKQQQQDRRKKEVIGLPEMGKIKVLLPDSQKLDKVNMRHTTGRDMECLSCRKMMLNVKEKTLLPM